MEDITKTIKATATRYGYDAQSRQLIEEMAELTQALNKFWRKQLQCGKIKRIIDVPIGTPEELDIIEEIADVEICITQIKYLLGIKEDSINRVKKNKVARELERIRESEATNE